MSFVLNHSEYVAACDLQPGDRVLYADLVIRVAQVLPTPGGVEVECRDESGSARLFLHRTVSHQFEVLSPRPA
jgi:hypothetical protein